MTSKERFLKTLNWENVDVPWSRGFAGMWPETLEIWREQGYQDTDLSQRQFGLDELLFVGPWYGPMPMFEYQVIQEDE